MNMGWRHRKRERGGEKEGGEKKGKEQEEVSEEGKGKQTHQK